jgi:polysaccharide deacetylase family protein (PEP-CTERM system associated)
MKILTFDLEDWFHILDNADTRGVEQWARYPSRFESGVDRILNLLDRNNTKATFFCLGWMAETHPSVIRRIHSSGHEIGTHSFLHQLAYEQSQEEFTNDLSRSISVIEDLLSDKVRYYRAPGFSLTTDNAWVFDVLIAHGIEVDCSVFPAARAHGGFPDFGVAQPVIVKAESGTIKEFPINVAEILGAKLVFSGGGYFRLLPYPLIQYLATRADYLMTYFHTRDFDPGQPIVPGLNSIRRFKSYYGLGSAEEKLNRFLCDFEFIDLRAALSLVDWDSAPVLSLNRA